MWAALLTSQVTFSVNTYRKMEATKKAVLNDSPQKYQGTSAGIAKESVRTKGM
jgi:hypothetical protein